VTLRAPARFLCHEGRAHDGDLGRASTSTAGAVVVALPPAMVNRIVFSRDLAAMKDQLYHACRSGRSARASRLRLAVLAQKGLTASRPSDTGR